MELGWNPGLLVLRPGHPLFPHLLRTIVGVTNFTWVRTMDCHRPSKGAIEHVPAFLNPSRGLPGTPRFVPVVLA